MGYERWWPAPSVPAPSTTPLPSTQMPQSAMHLVSIATGGAEPHSGCEFPPEQRRNAESLIDGFLVLPAISR